jgi:hypothetical protein
VPMSLDLQKSVVLITSSDRANKSFGTGFVVRRCGSSAYVVTCAHVIEDVGGIGQVRVKDGPVQGVVIGERDGIDLAVMIVPGLRDAVSLDLSLVGAKDQSFSTAGFQFESNTSTYLLRPLQGSLGEQIVGQSRGRIEQTLAWDLRIQDNYSLQPGYSGSPLLDAGNGCVLGIVSHSQGTGDRGRAISVEALHRLWTTIDSKQLQRSLWRLGYKDHAFLFMELLERESIVGFLIHGMPDYGQRWLLNRLVSQYVPNSLTGQVVKIHLNRRARRTGLTALWSELGRELGLRSDDCLPDVIVAGVCRWWRTQHVLLIFHEVNCLPETDFQVLIQQFWLPLAQQAKKLQSPDNPYKLLMFMVDNEGSAENWNLPFAEKIDDAWEAHIPVRSPKLVDFCDRDLKDWIQDAYSELPSNLTHKPLATVKAILEHSAGGVPELAFGEICDRCGYDWYEESKIWLTL